MIGSHVSWRTSARRAATGALAFAMSVALVSVAAPSAAEAEAVVEVSKLGFSPANLSIRTGTVVIWKNTNAGHYPAVGGTHTLVADDGSFRSPPIGPGASWTFRFLNPGRIAYRDEGTPSHTATIAVTGDPVRPPAADKEVAIVEPSATDYQTWGYDPVDVVIETGATVTWRNNGAQGHTVTADDGSFDSGDMPGGAVYKKTFEAPGAFTYFCKPHPW
ncbi:MAG TPA: plastocyanin/azurin family copper-binding protein, partial [Actinomycetota bacterium]|nr:plastocyanin/azurin family copper-binding protein [Actinomycetota bacterium]